MEIDTLKGNPDLVRLNPILQASPHVEERPKRSKYGSVRTEYAGRVYDSGREANRARELDLMRNAGDILAWFPQVRFPLAAGIVYVADFVVILPGWEVIVEDVKSPATRKDKTYRLKRRLFREKYGREIEEV